MEDVLLSLQGRAHGERYIDEDLGATYPLGFMQVHFVPALVVASVHF